MNMQVLDARSDVSGGYKVDVSRGQRIGRVSSEWFSRPDDERYLSLGDLARSVRGRSERSRTRVVESALIHVEANRNDPERLALILPGTAFAIKLHLNTRPMCVTSIRCSFSAGEAITQRRKRAWRPRKRGSFKAAICHHSRADELSKETFWQHLRSPQMLNVLLCSTELNGCY